MKAVIPVTYQNEEYVVSTRFARSNLFAVAEKNTGTYIMLKNPFSTKTTDTGRKIMEWLRNDEKIDTIIAFEIGLYVQQFAAKAGMRMILISDRFKKLDDLLELMGISKEIVKP